MPEFDAFALQVELDQAEEEGRLSGDLLTSLRNLVSYQKERDDAIAAPLRGIDLEELLANLHALSRADRRAIQQPEGRYITDHEIIRTAMQVIAFGAMTCSDGLYALTGIPHISETGYRPVPRPFLVVEVPRSMRDRRHVDVICPNCMSDHLRNVAGFPAFDRRPINLSRITIRMPGQVMGELEIFTGQCSQCHHWLVG